MRLHRFYVLQPLGEEVVIQDVSLVNQWTKVFRYEVGDFVILFNGDGSDYQYSLDAITKKECALHFVKSSPSYIPSRKITLCLSVIKKDNFELAVQKATELGVTTITPILSSRSEKKNLSIDRLHKIAIESAEQCGRGDIPTITDIISLKKLPQNIIEADELITLSIDGVPLIERVTLHNTTDVVIFIGPEGGWSDEDTAYLVEYGAKPHSLGKTMLRAETAAIAACTLLCI